MTRALLISLYRQRRHAYRVGDTREFVKVNRQIRELEQTRK